MTDQAIRGLSIRIDPTWPYRYLWIHPLGEIINLTYLDFGQGFQDSSQPNYAETDIPGRGELYQTFIGTSNKEISFTVQFRVQGTGDDAVRREVVYPARWLDSCKHPLWDDGASLMQAPPPVLFRVGSLFLIRAIVTQADIHWMEPFEPTTLLPHAAEVNVTLKIVRKQDPDLGYRYESITQGHWR